MVIAALIAAYFFLAIPFFISTFAIPTKNNRHTASIPFCWKVYFHRNIDDCPVYGVILHGKLCRQFRQIVCQFWLAT